MSQRRFSPLTSDLLVRKGDVTPSAMDGRPSVANEIAGARVRSPPRGACACGTDGKTRRAAIARRGLTAAFAGNPEIGRADILRRLRTLGSGGGKAGDKP